MVIFECIPVVYLILSHKPVQIIEYMYDCWSITFINMLLFLNEFHIVNV